MSRYTATKLMQATPVQRRWIRRQLQRMTRTQLLEVVRIILIDDSPAMRSTVIEAIGDVLGLFYADSERREP